MIIYPSGESKTDYVSPPWATIVWVVISVTCYFVFVPKLTRELAGEHERANQKLLDLVTAQYKSGQLDRITWLRFNEDPSIVANPEMNHFFPEQVRLAWIEVNDPRPPLTLIANKLPNNLLLAVTPHDLLVLLVGIFCLVFIGFLLEHLYDPLFVFATYLVSGALMMLAPRYLPLSFQPSLLLAWSHGLLVMLWLGWIVSPKAKVTLSVRAWLGRAFGDDYPIPSLVFPLIFTAAFVGLTLWNSPYGSYLRPLPAAVLCVEAVVLALMFVILPTRPPARTMTAEEMMLRDLAEAELRFAEDDAKAGHEMLHRLAKLEPERRHMRTIADLAWQNNDFEHAKHCYLHLIRKANMPGDSAYFLDILYEILFRRLPISGSYLVKGMHIAIESRKRDLVQKLMPFLLDHNEISHEEVTGLIEKLASRELEQKEPDRLMISQLQDWFQNNAPDSNLLPQIARFFQGGASESNLTGNFAQYRRINRLVDVELIDVQADKVIVRLLGQKEQRIPWTAVIGVYGCHISTVNRGFRGCLVIQFQRKVFGCVFTSARILFRNRVEPVTFERVWELLSESAPEDIPLMLMKDFPTFNDDTKLLAHIETFINPD